MHTDKMLTTEQGSELWRYLQGLSRFWKPVSCQRSWSAVWHPCVWQQPPTSEFVLAGQTVSCSVLKWHLVFVQGRDSISSRAWCCCLTFPYFKAVQVIQVVWLIWWNIDFFIKYTCNIKIMNPRYSKYCCCLRLTAELPQYLLTPWKTMSCNNRLRMGKEQKV